MSNCFLVSDMNINLLETSAIGSKYLNSLKVNGCYQGIKEPTRVTPTSKSLLDHIVHKDCLSNHEFGVVKTNITDHHATYVYWKQQDLNPFVSNKSRQQYHFFGVGTIKRNT